MDDGSEYPYKGDLKFRDVTVDPTTGSVILRIVFPNSKDILMPGMFVRAVLQEGVHKKAILVPQQQCRAILKETLSLYCGQELSRSTEAAYT